jgi:hypothetical protein
MKQPIHTPGPIKWSEDFGLYSDNGTITNAYNGAQYDDSSDPATIEISKPDARLLVAGYNAFDSAAQHLGLNAVEFAECMADSGIAQLVDALRAAHREIRAWRDGVNVRSRNLHDAKVGATYANESAILDILAKVKGGKA